MKLENFITHYSLNSSQIMWFLGAGASRSAGMPSATDIIWDLKKRYYCLKENREISDNDLSNEAVTKKIQLYLEANGCPPIWSEEEYAYYFNLVLGDIPSQHQKYLADKLDANKISINSGHRILASLMAMKKAKVVFTTNFDSVLENAYAFMTGTDLHAYSLDGSYAALNALNNESFPIYAKMHGDFRYYEMKNLPDQLRNNDAEIENCFINACSRYGLVVTGYSGRDINVMAAFDKALENTNAFPKGLFWITSVQGTVFPAVTSLIEKANRKGINAHIIEGDTFDSLLLKIWKQTPKSLEYDQKVRRSIFQTPKIDRYPTTGNFPIIRTNAFPILSLPRTCQSIEIKQAMSNQEFKERVITAKSAAIMVKDKTILAWGALEDINKIIPNTEIAKIETLNLNSHVESFDKNTIIKSFYTYALARALVKDKPLKLKRRKGKYFAVLSVKHEKYDVIEGKLKDALAAYDYNTKKSELPKSLVGHVPGIATTFWMECVELSLEYYDRQFWLNVVPDIWIEPEINRKDAVEFLKNKKKSRYNNIQNKLLDVWKEILIGTNKSILLKPYNHEVNNPEFEISTITAYSLKQTQ